MPDKRRETRAVEERTSPPTPVIYEIVRRPGLALSREAMDATWLEMLFRAITAGFLMAGMVGLLPGAESGQFHVITLMTYLIAISGGVHIVTGSVQAFMLIANGAAGARELTTGFGAPVLTGNIIGGTALFAMISYAQVMKEI